ncbi:ROK family transcriptional regulator [Actinoplanes sp. RD1]|uniref:ROK family transcriptional regulator n=1 Tax=Actinoplanes sp. RD1 TaxID=3064538 RepID=UPI002741D2CE|nr:ROK family transcriptional regulator [Actinoplanes sp. RD1]
MASGDHKAGRRGSGGRNADRHGSTGRVLEALRTGGPCSQAGLARQTGLSPATINNVVRQLRADGIADVQPVNGRESLVALVSGRGIVVAVHIGVSAMRAVLFDFGAGRRMDTAMEFADVGCGEGGTPEVVAAVVRDLAARASLSADRLAGVAIAMPAPIARSTGAITSWARIHLPAWRDVAIATVLSERLGTVVVAENDANLAALAEWTWGAGRGSSDFLYVMCSAGVGGGLILNGEIYRGGDGLAGEMGHMVLEESGPYCFCGSRGCLTTFTSQHAILTALGASLGTTKGSLREVIDSARAGDPTCRRVLYEAGSYLGRAFANAAKVMAPSVMAVGGDLGAAGDLVFDGLNSSVEIGSLRAASPSIRIQPAQTGADAAVLGGVAAVMDHIGQGLSTVPEWMGMAAEAASAAVVEG